MSQRRPEELGAVAATGLAIEQTVQFTFFGMLFQGFELQKDPACAKEAISRPAICAKEV